MLGKRGDGLQRLKIARPLPVREKLIAVERRPLAHESQRPGRELACDHRSVERDRRAIARLLSMEVRNRMITLP